MDEEKEIGLSFRAHVSAIKTDGRMPGLIRITLDIFEGQDLSELYLYAAKNIQCAIIALPESE